MTDTPLPVACDNCDWKGTDDQIALADVEDLYQRLDPGGIVPAGECPECRCLAYIVKDKE